MSLQISFELSDADLEYFCDVLKQARKSSINISAEEIIENSRQLLAQIKHSDAQDFVRDRINQLNTLIDMLEDTSWHLTGDDRERVMTALSYFFDAADLIPDDIPGLGFLDDAIMIEIVCQELRHEIQAYQDFVQERTAKVAQPTDNDDSHWLEKRRAQLHDRMRRRRGNQANKNKTKSRFSLF
jgi:uncharacterized membrane protein YkvA (DUF1232 family)